MSYSDGFSTVRPTTYGPFASKAECEKAKEGADWEQWHNVPGTGPTIEEKESLLPAQAKRCHLPRYDEDKSADRQGGQTSE
jgi:hypothetical protein